MPIVLCPDKKFCELYILQSYTTFNIIIIFFQQFHSSLNCLRNHESKKVFYEIDFTRKSKKISKICRFVAPPQATDAEVSSC